LLVHGDAGGLAHFQLSAGEMSRPVQHRSVEELWYFVGGHGEMCIGTEVTEVAAGLAVRIPPRTRFQFLSRGPEPLAAVAVTMPKWPAEGDAIDAAPHWVRDDAGRITPAG